MDINRPLSLTTADFRSPVCAILFRNSATADDDDDDSSNFFNNENLIEFPTKREEKDNSSAGQFLRSRITGGLRFYERLRFYSNITGLGIE
jgi:hypothetical protein